MINLPLRPLRCNYYLTYRCGSTCEFCDIWRSTNFKDKDETSFSNIENNLRDLKELGIKYIDFSGGEPLIRDDLPEILRLSKNLGFITSLTTDGTKYSKMSYDIADLVDYLFFSLDAPEAIEHNRIRGADCFDKALASIKIATKLKQYPIINFTVTRDSLGQLPDMVALADSLGVRLNINPVYNHFGLQGFESDSINYIKRYFRNNNVLMNLASLEFIRKNGNRAGLRSRCRAMQSVITISPDNHLVIPCIFYQKEKIKIENNLKMLYNSPKAQKAGRYQGMSDNCEGCMCWPYINPSFTYKLDNYFLLNLISFGSFLMKDYIIKQRS